MAADWSELPKDLLNLISKRIDNEIDLIRFRSICTNWRSSSIRNHHRDILTINFPFIRPLFNNDSITNKTPFRNNLSKHSFFLIKPPQEQTLVGRRLPWLFKIIQSSTGKTEFQYGLHSSSGPVFDFNKFSLLHLATNFIPVDNQTKVPKSIDGPVVLYIYLKKAIAVTSHGKKPIILGTFSVSGSKDQPVVFKCGDENWKIIPEISAYSGDICVFKGRPYVVDKTGRTVTVGPEDSTVQLVAESLVGGGDIKFLVERKGDLLLADVCNHKFDDDDDDDDIKVVKIDVFKLNEREKKWVKLANLGDIVLFLGSQCSFSASASDLCVPKGNCVIIMDNIFTRVCCESSFIIMDNIFTRVCCESSFLDLDDGRLSPLTDYPEYLELFRPKWIKKQN